MNIFVLRGDMTADSNDLDQALEKIHYQQQTLADKLEKQPLNRRKATLTPRFDEGNKPGIPLLPVLKEITIRQDGISLSQPPKVLMQPPRANGFDFQTPLMSEDGHLILPGDDSRPGSVFNSRHSSSQQMSPRQPNIDLGLFQGPAALVHFRMRTKDEMVALCGGDDKFFPLHPSIGALHPASPCETIHCLNFSRHFAAKSAILGLQHAQGQENQYASCVHGYGSCNNI
jgi:hypothetical protein